MLAGRDAGGVHTRGYTTQTAALQHRVDQMMQQRRNTQTVTAVSRAICVVPGGGRPAREPEKEVAASECEMTKVEVDTVVDILLKAFE